MYFNINYLKKCIKKITSEKPSKVNISPLTGDASSREYYRITYTQTNCNQEKSIILMHTKDPQYNERTPYFTVYNHFKKHHIYIPETYFFDNTEGNLFIEDLGDITLEKHVRNIHGDSELIKGLYKRAIDNIINIQKSSIEGNFHKHPLSKTEFDIDKYMYEFKFFLTYAIEGLFRKKIKAVDRDKFIEIFLHICRVLYSQDKFLVHRDYHSRNIMIHNDDLVTIDFQDARMGPSQYDLASLLRDSYLVLDNILVKELLGYYLLKRGFNKITNKSEFIRIFDYSSLQRNIKAIGTFAFQSCIKKNHLYERYIPATYSYINSNLEKYTELSPLSELFKIYFVYPLCNK